MQMVRWKGAMETPVAMVRYAYTCLHRYIRRADWVIMRASGVGCECHRHSMLLCEMLVTE